MALQSCGLISWPALIATDGSDAFAVTAATLTFDSTSDRVAFISRAPVTDSITKVYIRTGTVTTGSTIEVRIETVTNGRPSGTLWAANTNITVVIANTDDNVWKTATLTSAASMTIGQEFAIVIINSSGTPNLLFNKANATFRGTSGQYPLLLQDTGTGTWGAADGAGLTRPFEWIVEMSSAGPVYLSGLLPVDGDAVAATYNSGSSPDEKALRFQVPFKCRCIGAGISMLNTAAGADFTVSLWPTSSTQDANALAQIAEDGDYAYTATIDGYVNIYFNTAVTLVPATTYYLGVRADTVNNITITEIPVPSGVTNAINALPIPPGGNIYKSHRTWTAGTAGAWTDTTTTLPLISLYIDQLDDGVNSGGMASLFGYGLVK